MFSNGVVIHKKFDQTTQKKHPFPTKLGEVPTQIFFPLIGLDICLRDWDLPKKIIPKNLGNLFYNPNPRVSFIKSVKELSKLHINNNVCISNSNRNTDIITTAGQTNS